MLTIAILIWLWMALLDAPDNVILQGAWHRLRLSEEIAGQV